MYAVDGFGLRSRHQTTDEDDDVRDRAHYCDYYDYVCWHLTYDYLGPVGHFYDLDDYRYCQVATTHRHFV